MRLLILILLTITVGWGVTGEVLLRGTAIESSHFTGFPAANAFDADLTTFWASNTNGGWVGLDIGSGNTSVLTRFRITPRQVVPGDSDWNPNLLGAQVQGSNDCTFATGVSTLATITNTGTNWLHDHQYNEAAATGSTPFRCFRVFGTGLVTNGLQVAELQLIGTISAGTPSGSPDWALVSQTGGVVPLGTTVTLSSLTTSASLYYTTDGSTPTTGSTLYSAPFALTASVGGTALKVLANDATLSTPAALVTTINFYPQFTMQPDWYDDRQRLIQAASGGITWDPSTSRYYWFGSPMTVATFSGFEPVINLYSSGSLYGPWRFESAVIAGISATRMHVIKNASTSKWVMWAHNDPADKAMVATADTITGPWTVINATLDPDGVGYKDANLFLDGTTAYTVYVNGAQDSFIISQLASDYLTTSGSNITIANGGREGPVMFRRGSVYFLISSSAGFYSNPFTQYYQTASSALGTYTSFTSMGSYQSQSSFMISPQGKTDAYMLGCDHWTPGSGSATAFYSDSRQQWMPLVFPTTTSVTMAESPWDLTLWDGHGGSAVGGKLTRAGKLSGQ